MEKRPLPCKSGEGHTVDILGTGEGVVLRPLVLRTVSILMILMKDFQRLV